jgi:cupredoxin-like protein
MESEAEVRSSGADWAKVLRISAIELVALMLIVMAFLIQGIEPVLLVFALAFVIGLVVFNAKGRPGAITLLVIGMIFVLANLPFTVPTLFALNSPLEFILNLLFLLGGLGTIIAAVNLVLGNDGAGSTGPRRWLLISAVVVAVLAVVSVVVRLTDEQATARPGDLRLVAEETEFSQAQLHGDEGEVGVFIQNKDPFSHTFVIEKLEVHLDLPGFSSKRVDFEAGPGLYEFRCTIPGHEDMKGTLAIG